MYRQGLGDCFLLTFPGQGGRPCHVLIDCGVIVGTSNPADVMGQVARDIAAATDNHLHVLVATHEHWDHLSGFIQAQDVFDKIKIDEVWFAWTEDPADALAAHLRAGRQRALQALRSTMNSLKALNHPAAPRVQGLLDFFGAAGGNTTRAALEYLADHPLGTRVRYRRPGEAAVPLPGVAGARVFVLGPPHDEQAIKRSSPTKSGHEVYELFCQGAQHAVFAPFGASAADVAADPTLAWHSQAFDENLRLSPDRAAALPFFQKRYPKADADPEAWRRIDNDFLDTAEELALNLDSNTNNTSLALAIEVSPGGGVLLFPGDAQVGNWLSWDRYTWPADRAGEPPITSADLLRRTVLYKVGHHASHNATLRAGGLELMESPDLVALIPVDHAMAVKKHWNGMPFPSLLDRLHEKTRGRVLRIDQDVPKAPAGVSAARWKQFTDHVTATELYFDYTL
jgi:hypothetical protein